MKFKYPILVLAVCLALWAVCFPSSGCAEDASTELVILSTTDMHGKCWETNLMTGGKVTANMLRVATAVRQGQAGAPVLRRADRHLLPQPGQRVPVQLL